MDEFKVKLTKKSIGQKKKPLKEMKMAESTETKLQILKGQERQKRSRKVKGDMVIIPKFIREALKIKSGDEIVFKLLEDGKVLMWKA